MSSRRRRSLSSDSRNFVFSSSFAFSAARINALFSASTISNLVCSSVHDRNATSSVRENVSNSSNKMPCYRKDDRAMHPIYKLFHPNFFHAYGHYTLVCADLILNEFKLWKFCIFLQEGRFDLSRSSKVIDAGANWKRACDFQFLSVRHCNLGPILHRFWDMTVFMCSLPHLYSTLILGVFPLHKIAHVGVSERMDLKLSGREIFFEAFQPMWKSYLNVTDRRTDRQTTYNLITALCVASRGNKHKKSCFFRFWKKRSPTSNILLRMCGHKKLCNWELCVINAYKYP